MRSPLSPELSRLIEQHRAALATFESTSEDDENFIGASRAEDEARYDVAMRPCVSDAEFIEKLRYLLDAEISLWGEPEFLTEFGSVVVAVREYLDQRDLGAVNPTGMHS
jgi:hypothetical protein